MSSYAIKLDTDHPLTHSHRIKISLAKQVPVFMLLQEQISRAFFRHFRQVGMTGCIYENTLDRLLLASVGLDDGTSKTHQLYNQLMTTWAVQNNDDDRAMISKALKVYDGLIKARGKEKPVKGDGSARQITFSIVLNDQRPLVQSEKTKISVDMQVPLYLIRHELQTRALFDHLHLNNEYWCAYEPFLDRFILTCVGLNDGSDETFAMYSKIMELRALKIEDDNEMITKKAFAVYRALMKQANRML